MAVLKLLQSRKFVGPCLITKKHRGQLVNCYIFFIVCFASVSKYCILSVEELEILRKLTYQSSKSEPWFFEILKLKV